MANRTRIKHLTAKAGCGLLCLGLLSACSNTNTTAGYEPAQTVLSRPNLGATSYAKVGATLYSETPAVIHDAIYLSAPQQFGDAQQLEAAAGFYNRAQGSSSGGHARYIAMHTDNEQLSGSITQSGTASLDHWLELRSETTLCLVSKKSEHCEENTDAKAMPRRVPKVNSSQQSLEFTSVNDNSLKITYKKIASAWTMVLEEKEWVLNTRQTRVVSINGCTLEIISLANNRMAYRINTGFYSSQALHSNE